MSGFMNTDGSELVGGQLPSGVGQALQLDNSGNLKTTATVTPPSSAVSTGNSSTALLAGGATFTGAWESALAYGSISVQAFADQASAASGLIIEQSQDGTNADTQAASSVLASTAFQQTVNLTGQYFRVVYTNGGSNQGTFRLQTIKEVAVSPSSGVANQRVNAHAGDFVAGSISDLSTLPASLTELLGDTDNLASILTQDTTTATNTTTLAGVVSGGKAAVKVASGDVADGAVVGIGTTTQTKATDATATSWSVIQLLKGIFNSLLGVLTISRSTIAVYSLASTTTSGATQNSGDLTVGPYTEISLDITTTAQAGTNPTIQYFYERKAADGLYYILWQSAVLTAAANTLSTSIGAGMAYNQSLGVTGRLRWVIGGTATPTFTHSLNIQGK